MHELVRTNNPVLISAISALLDEAGIPYFVLDQNMLPRRMMVAGGYADAARTLLTNAGLGRELRPDAD